MSWIMGQECKETRMYGTFIKSVLVQAILLFISDMWLSTTGLGWTLGGFHNIVALRKTKTKLVGFPIAVGSTPHFRGYVGARG